MMMVIVLTVSDISFTKTKGLVQYEYAILPV